MEKSRRKINNKLMYLAVEYTQQCLRTEFVRNTKTKRNIDINIIVKYLIYLNLSVYFSSCCGVHTLTKNYIYLYVQLYIFVPICIRI